MSFLYFFTKEQTMENLIDSINSSIVLTEKESREAEKAYQALLTVALGLIDSEIQPFPGFMDVARHNAMIAFQEAKKLEAKLKEIVKADLLSSIDRIPAIALAASFAAVKVKNLSSSFGGDTLILLEQGRTLRRKLLKSADACAEYGLLNASTVENIRKGRGSRDVADDCIALASLFRENKASLSGKTPVPDSDVDQSALVGSRLQAVLRPARASSAPAPTDAELEAYDLRDRFWTLLVQHRDVAWRLGALVVGEQKVSELVPPLLSRERVKTPDTPEVKQAKQEAKAAKEVAAKAGAEAKEKAKTAAKVSKDARKRGA
jgi:hypothetical protein